MRIPLLILLACVLGWRRREFLFPWLLAGSVSLVVFHDLWRCYPRDYYFAPLGVVGALSLIRLYGLRPRLGTVLLVLGLLWNARHALDDAPVIESQREMSMAGSLVAGSVNTISATPAIRRIRASV